MQIHGHVDLVFLDHLGDGVAHALGQVAVGHAGIGPVQIPGLTAGQGLSGGVVSVHVRIRPLVYRVGGPGAENKGPASALCLNVEELEGTLLGIVVGKGAVVGPGDHIEGAGIHLGALHQGDGSHMTSGLVGVGAAQDQHAGPLLLPL